MSTVINNAVVVDLSAMSPIVVQLYILSVYMDVLCALEKHDFLPVDGNIVVFSVYVADR